MREYSAPAVILDKEPLRDFDNRVIFYTEKFGKLTGRTVSTRKITSKLAAHLEPGNMVNLRFVEKKNLQIVDGLKTRKIKATPAELYALNGLLPEGEPDQALWEHLRGARFSWKDILRILGWDPAGAPCANCSRSAAAFHKGEQGMYCRTCALKLDPDKLIYF